MFFLRCYMFRLRILTIVTEAQYYKEMSSVLQVGKYLPNYRRTYNVPLMSSKYCGSLMLAEIRSRNV